MTERDWIWLCIGLSVGAWVQWMVFKLNGMLRSREEWHHAKESNHD